MKLRVSRCERVGLIVTCLVLLSLSHAFATLAVSPTNSLAYVPNEYIIQATPGASLSAVQQSAALINGTVVKTLPLPDVYVIRIGTSGSSAGGAMRVAMGAVYTPWVIRTFSPNYMRYPTATPDDALWPKQWGMTSINMPQAWNVEKGSTSVTVAVLDTGVADHPDLVGRVGPGYDFVDNDADPSNDVSAMARTAPASSRLRETTPRGCAACVGTMCRSCRCVSWDRPGERQATRSWGWNTLFSTAPMW